MTAQRGHPGLRQDDRNTWIHEARGYQKDHAEMLQHAQKQYRVDPDVITAIILVETKFGRYLFEDAEAICSIANYLKFYGWKPGIDRDKAYKVVMHYNRSAYYANAILKIAALLKEKS
jgi:membrane-bound lytic murein transglycosylase B